MNIQQSISLPLEATSSLKAIDDNTNQADCYFVKTQSLDSIGDRTPHDINGNFGDESPFCSERDVCQKMYNALRIDNNSSRSTADSMTSLPARNDSPSLFTPEDFIPDFIDTVKCDDVEREYFLRCVVVGAKDTGKHTLINANFNQEIKRSPLDKSDSDFLIKRSKQENTTKKYHFWVRTLGEQSVTKDLLWRTYYKWANAFVFVYDTTSKESFEALKQEVDKILQIVPKEEFFGVLVGMKNDQHAERAVDYEDVINFKLSHNLNCQFETDSFSEKDAPQLLKRLNGKLKLTFEAL